jgi:predicted ATPase
MSEKTGWNMSFRFGNDRLALANLPEDQDRFRASVWVKQFLQEGVQRIALNAEAIRRPSPPGLSTGYMADGSNLPLVVKHLSENDTARFESWIEHVRTAIEGVRNIRTVERDEDRNSYLVIEYSNGLTAPSWVVSDGTLRLLALTLLAYIPTTHGIYLLEEPENGIHPKAVETVFQSISSIYDSQVLCASHSPVILSLARKSELLCFAKDEEGATDIVSGDDHPRLQDWREGMDLGSVFAAGVLG